MAEDSRRHALTEQFEELREAALREGLLRHGYRTARPVRTYLPSTAWKLSLPGFTNSLSSPVFKLVMAQHFCLPTIRECNMSHWSTQCSTHFLYTVSENLNGGIYDEQNRRNVRERLNI